VPAAMISPVTASLPTTDPGRSVLPAAPALPIAALEKLPAGPVGADPVWRLVAAFLVGYPPATARAYLGDLRAWIGWCTEEGVHPFTARRHHVDHWARHLATLPQPATGRPAAAATIARRLSCLSGFYDCGLREVELLEYSPVANVRRPAGLHHQLCPRPQPRPPRRLQDVQDAMGHADPRTTRRYDRSRHNLDRHPTSTRWPPNCTARPVRHRSSPARSPAKTAHARHRAIGFRRWGGGMVAGQGGPLDGGCGPHRV